MRARMRLKWRQWGVDSPLVWALALSPLALGCGSTGDGTGFPTGGGSSAPTANDRGDASIDDSSSALFADSGQFTPVFTSGDGAPPGVMFECEPGTYTGMFDTNVTNDAGGLLSLLFSFKWSGTLSITLVGQVMQSSSGENFAAPVLTIAAGAKLSGADDMGGHFNADLTGQLDCPTKALTGTLSSGTYEYPGDAGSITMQGSLSGTYDGTGTTPALTMGVIDVSSPQYPQISAGGTWSATHQ
jgi:hypothetical protein